ncbi:unnamed protein product [Adineta steineri]|uniref:LicD/FKTN/FKRP nucleotidyltransferase domain-containing protein n=1 Tax=Adineta steineri TaxID=433720 RepID=A0A814FL11_9BILA|nr:unnamed protein product [Adineta steineri]CAF3750569.1 unnamed protein product [Adineta steineri]
MFHRPRTIHKVGALAGIIFVVYINISILISIKSLQRSQDSIYLPVNFYNVSNNIEDAKTSFDDTSVWCLEMAQRLDNEKHSPLSPHLRSPSSNSTRLHRLPYRYSQWKSSPLLPRRLTRCEHMLLMHLLTVFERLCRTHQITFFMIGGTLLGSWVHHDIIPWDDDVDLLIPHEAIPRFSLVLNQMKNTLVRYKLIKPTKPKEMYYKIFFDHTPSAGEFSWNFPFLDIWFYKTNETHFWRTDSPEQTIDIKYVFPVVMRPFGELWLPAPHQTQYLINLQYENITCKGHYWNHKTERSQEEIEANCEDLKKVYPFVERDKTNNSIEVLRTNDFIVYTVVYN